jgi:hypothetical protein
MFDINKFKNLEPKHTRYEKQLRRIQKIHPTNCIEEAVEGAVNNIKQNKSKAFVIYGEPQSGKTEMMICLTSKLLDEGHKIIIVLLNDNDELLNQNFKRFCYSGIDPTPKKYDQILDPSVKIGDSPWVIFCKKNSHNLRNLIEKIGNKKEKIIIDDEADYATPDSNVNKKDKGPTAINKYVGSLLDQNAIYIGVTATPARLDLNDTYENDNEKWINFPSHPAYTGQDSFFPIDVNSREFLLNFLPEDGDDPKYLREALFSFLVNVAYLNTIDDGDERNFSMLVHTSGKIVDQDEDYKDIIGIMQGLSDKESSVFERYLKRIWEISKERYPDEVDSIVEYIMHNRGKITPIVMNNKSNDDYEPATNPATPFTVVIGGNIISRGVTFNNLLSMFFTRDVKHKIQQDTYIQRARMFGSRGDILKYFELHIPQKLYKDWHRCFIFHRLSWEAIKNGDAPVWLADKRVTPSSKSSINKTTISIDQGEMDFDMFDYTDEIKKVWNDDSINERDRLEKLKLKLDEKNFPKYLLDWVDKNNVNAIFIHKQINPVDMREGTDPETIRSKTGYGSRFGGGALSKSNVLHHFAIFYNKKDKARLVYRYTENITFLKKVK